MNFRPIPLPIKLGNLTSPRKSPLHLSSRNLISPGEYLQMRPNSRASALQYVDTRDLYAQPQEYAGVIDEIHHLTEHLYVITLQPS